MHTIVRDIIANVIGPGWSFGLARVLIDSDGNAAVFVPPGNEPVQTFKVVVGTDAQGTGTDANGKQVTYRRRSSSCSFALAKCNTKTSVLTKRWDAVTVPVQSVETEVPASVGDPEFESALHD